MAREIEIKVGNERAIAVLLENEAPNTCKRIVETLPLRGGLIHAKFAGGEYWIGSPIFVDGMENPVRKQNPGNVCYWYGRQFVCIFYKDLPGLEELTLFARVVKNLDGIQREGLKGWVKQGTPIEISEVHKRD